MSSRSGKAPGSSARGVQFGMTVMKRSIGSNASVESTESYVEPPEEISKPDFGMSWNERMRHQPSPMVNRRQDSLDPVTCTLFVVVLNRCAEGLAIVRETNAIPYVDLNLDYVPMVEKYENCEFYELDSNDTMLDYNKFRTDISWVEKVIKVVLENLRRSWSFESFQKVLHDYQLTCEDENELLMAKKFNQNELLKLRQCAEVERNQLVKNIQELTEKLGNRKDELNDGIKDFGIKTRFLKNWERARYEQNKMILTSKENSYTETTRTMAIQIERENRVHEELQTYLEESLTDYQEEIEKMMTKYDEDLDAFEIKIGKMKIQVEKQKDLYTALQEEFDHHHNLIEEYKEHKLQKLREKEEMERRNAAASKIQFWWRNVMFIKGLGPFRRKKGKGKKGSGKDSGKKSKK